MPKNIKRITAGKLCLLLGITIIAASWVLLKDGSSITIRNRKNVPEVIIDTGKYEQIRSAAIAEAQLLFPAKNIPGNPDTNIPYSVFIRRWIESSEYKRDEHVSQVLKESGLVIEAHAIPGVYLGFEFTVLMGIILTSLGVGLLWIPRRNDSK